MSHFSSRQQLSPLMRPYSPAFNCVAAFSPIFSLAETGDRRKALYLNRTLLHHSCNHFSFACAIQYFGKSGLKSTYPLKKKMYLGNADYMNMEDR